ncbi:hypothetical protein FGG08_007351 [Glutinoglossum americanum]|uniref:Uncharacterized protein n=1 Tax=Glutinoglossum americanum TaxID=1670608 RepID=A0A9P8KZF8_9PEZI|nr:hypothetical protein FGG08_007351 [Glutinoglossum americanum]
MWFRRKLKVSIVTDKDRFAVLIDTSFTVAQLQGKALERAKSIGLLFDPESTVLRERDNDGAILFSKDRVVDVLGPTRGGVPEFWLGYKGDYAFPHLKTGESSAKSRRTTAASSISGETVTSSAASTLTIKGHAPRVYIRWITARRAFEHSLLQGIGIDRKSYSPTTTIPELRSIAYDRIFNRNSCGEDRLPPDSTVDLFTLNCHLSTRDSFTLDDLELQGDPETPLDIFVVLRNTKPTTDDRPYDACSFSSSHRGFATFEASLRMFLNEINQGRISLERVLEVLWEVTHFPPCVIAFQQLLDYSGHLDSKLPAVPFAMFATSFREAAMRMVPPWISATPLTILESSRQVFGWVYSLCSEPVTLGTTQSIIHKVELSERAAGSNDDDLGLFNYNEEVDLFSEGPSQRVSVSKEAKDDISPGLLARALKGSYEEQWNYYFDLPANYYFKLPLMASSPQEQKRVPPSHPAEFEKLIQATNKIDALRMIGPLALTNSTPPFITLDREGYVSIYQMKSQCCDGPLYTCIWNTINGEEVVKSPDAGKSLFDELQPVIEGRKMEGTWEIDAWNDADVAGVRGPPVEGIVICVDKSASMRTVMPTGWVEGAGTQKNLARIDEARDIFENVAARVVAYELPAYLGLVTFSHRAHVRTNHPINHATYEFKSALVGIEASGNTAMWDALVRAKELLVGFKEEHPESRLRVIILTDGEDNNSRYGAAFACSGLYENDVVVDAVVIGTNSTADLFRIAKHTGGYAFNPKTRNAMFQIPLLETFTDIRMRPDIVKVPIGDFETSTPKSPDMTNIFDFPPCKPHANQNDTFVSLRGASRYIKAISNRSIRAASSANSVFSGWDGATARSGASGPGRSYMHELRAMADNPHGYMDIYVSERDMGFWKVVMQGPPGSPYADGVFVLLIELGPRFPQIAPTARFITPVLHPNITKIREAVDPWFTLKMWTDQQGARKEISAYVSISPSSLIFQPAAHRMLQINHWASRSREQLRTDILGPDASTPFGYCHSEGCNSGQEHTSGNEAPLMTCIACGFKNCFFCDSAWHEGRTCREHQVKKNEEYIAKHTKACPGCGAPGAKECGCIEIKCILYRDIVKASLEEVTALQKL